MSDVSGTGVSRLVKNLNLQDSTKCNIPEKLKKDTKEGQTDQTQGKVPPKGKKMHTISRNGVTLFFGKESIFSNLYTQTQILIDGKITRSRWRNSFTTWKLPIRP